MNRLPSITDRIRGLKRFFVFYRKPEYLRAVKNWLDIRPEDIPAVEISDDDKLCKNPLVSVLIPTYNQERFIRQAIESALNQETDFEYEILIGDDCSTDGTGDICSTYQKTYPDKVRFITADRNVYQLGGNGNRLRCRARGEFLAHLEGDDYWTDKHKLQKQVDVFRRHPDVTLCLSGRETLRLDGTVVYAHNAHFDNLLAKSPEQDGTLFDGDDYFSHPLGGPVGVSMYRKSDINYDVFCTFYFRTSYTLYFLLLKKGRGYLLRKPMTMYRVNPNGVWNGKTPMEKARFSYEFFSQLLLHAPGNEAINSIQKFWWKQFRRHLFPWRLLSAIHRRLRWVYAFALGCFVVLTFHSIRSVPEVHARDKVDCAHEIIATQYLSPDGLLYAYIGELPAKEDCERGFPNALGYWTPIENTPMFTGSYLSAMVARAEKMEDYESAAECHRLANGLVKIASVSDTPGMIVRGFGKDGICHYSSTTTCQYTPWFLGLHSYATSRICPPAERQRITDVMVRIANGLAAQGWRCPCDGPLDGCFFGSINSKGLPHRDSAHYLFILAAMYDVTGDEVWRARYQAAKHEFCEKAKCTRLEACAKGWLVDQDYYNPEEAGKMWIYVCTQECLAELYRLDPDPETRASYREGMLVNADRARSSMVLAKKYDNDKGHDFKYANWKQGYSWSAQTNIVQALDVSRTGNQAVLGNRKWYERNYVTQPLAAAAICAYAGMHRQDVLMTINCLDYTQINICEFFFSEVAYWKFSQRKGILHQ